MAASAEYDDMCCKAFPTSTCHGNVLFYLVGKGNAITITDYYWSWWQNTSSKSGHIATFYVRSSSKFPFRTAIDIISFVLKIAEE